MITNQSVANTLPGRNFVSSWVSVDGYELLYAAAGQGPVLISLPGSAGIEMSVGKDLLAKHLRVVEINPPGWGQRDDFEGRMDQRELAHLLARAIEALGIEKYHLLGTSMGGINAMWLALHYPERVTSLVLDASMTFAAHEQLREPQQDVFISALRSGLIAPEQVEFMLNNLPPAPKYEAKPWQDQNYFRTLMSNRMRMMPHFPSNHDDELAEKAHSLTCPVLTLLGDADEILKPNMLARYEALMPQAKRQLVQGGSHDLQGSHPHEFANAVASFVRDAEGARS